MSRRAATTTTSTCGAAPSSAGTPPTTWCSITAWSRGIGICSWAWKRTAASISARVLDRGQAQGADDDALVADAEPHLLGELVLGEESLQRAGEAVGVEHLAFVECAGLQRLDRRCRDPRGAVGAVTSVAAMLPASMSRPAMPPVFLLRGQAQLEVRYGKARPHRPPWIDRRAPDLLPCNYRFIGKPGRTYEKAPRYQSTSWSTGQQADHAAEGEERPEGDRLLAGAGTLAGDRRQARPPTPRAGRRGSPGPTSRPRKSPITAASLTSPRPIPRG